MNSLTVYCSKVNMMNIVPADKNFIIGLTLLYLDSKN